MKKHHALLLRLLLLPLTTTISSIVNAQTPPSLNPGDIAIIGRINNTTPDSFIFAPLVDISAGTTLYFTDNGWTGTQFRGAATTDGDGNENLLKWVANNAIPAGTLINTTATSADFTFTLTGLVPTSGVSTGAFASLSLSQTGDQITAFQSAGAVDPLLNPIPIFMLDDTNGFENATSAATGNVAPGLTAGSTALTFNPSPLAGRFNLINDGTERDRGGWLTYISTSTNWEANATGVLPTSNLLFPSAAIPEPGTISLVFCGLGACAATIRRRQN
jgi:uncharacterized protein